MSSPYFNNGAALPHAEFLSYFRQLERDNGYDESAHTTRFASPSSSDVEDKVFDEEAQFDFWDLNSTTDTDCEVPHSSTRRGHQGIFHSLYDFWSFVSVVALSSCAVLLGLDLALGQYGMGMGLTDCFMGRHLVQSPIAHDLYFCLASPNREAPGPQTWHLMSPRLHDDCTTEVLTLLVSPSEGWKIHSNDEVIFGDKAWLQSKQISIGKSLGSDGLLRREKLGDNIAEEGVLSQSGVTSSEGIMII